MLEDVEKYLFNFIMSVEVSCGSTINKICGELAQIKGHELDIQVLMDNINLEIKNYDIEIVKGKSDLNGEEYFSLINTNKCSMSLHSKIVDKKVLTFFAVILRTCLSNGGLISETMCNNLATDAGVSKVFAQTTMDDLINKKWLENLNGNICLGVRTLMELGQDLQLTHPDNIFKCCLCLKLLSFGQECENCTSRIHYYCLEKYMEKSDGCPVCKSEITNKFQGNGCPPRKKSCDVSKLY